MDLDELLAYKPKRAGKHSLEGEQSDEAPPPSKIPRGAGAISGTAPQLDALNGISDEEKLRLLQNLDDEEADDVGEVLDSGGVKRMLLSFEKKVLKNQEVRIKFPDLPEKFMESELELNDEIQTLHIIATVPEHYPILVETNVIQTLVGLLSHDNSDIAIAVIDLLQELTDGENEVEKLIEALLSEQLVALLVQNLERLDEKVKEDSDGVHNTLAIVENMCEFKNADVSSAASEQGLLLWLLKRIRVRQFDANKLYAAEILAILLQGNEGIQRLIGERDGIDILLQALAYYKRRDPNGPDEIEMMENLFDCLCSALMYTPNRDRFLKGEGLQLMILMLKEKKMSRRSALKVLNHAMCNVEGSDNCVKFVEVYGLRSLFPSFMKTPKRLNTLAGTSGNEHEEHVCSIIASLFRNVKGAPRDRLISKFVENEHEKVDRLMELHFRHLRKVREVDEQIRREKRLNPSIDTTEADMEMYLRRLDAGLFVLQLVDYMTAELYLSGHAAIKARVETIMNQHGDSLSTVKQVLLEYAENIGDDSSGSESSLEQARITALAERLF